MAFFRWLFGLPLAAAITVGLFIFMAGLIKQDVRVDNPTPLTVIDILPKLKDTPPDGRDLPDKGKIDEEMPDIDLPPARPGDKPDALPVDPIPDPTGGDGEGIGTVHHDPVITVAPPYPESCRTRGVEGVVVVQFDVTPEGNVVNVQILSAPHICFRRIVSSIAKWKYPPAYQDGRPVMRYGVIEQFNFVLTE